MRIPLLVAPLALLCATVTAQDFSGNQQKAPDPRLQEANAALYAHDYERALKLLTPLAEAHPADARILFDLGAAQDALDQTSPAEQSYRAAIADDAKFLDPHVALALLLARNDRFDDARTELLAVKNVPSDDVALRARAFRALARIDQNLRPSDARDELLEALKLTPETPSDILFGAELAENALHGGEAAEVAYRRYLAAQPNDPAGTAGLAHLLVTELRSEEAEALLTSALKAHPGDPALTAQLAAIYIHAGKNADAIPLLAQVYAANPQDANIGQMLAGLYRSVSDYTHAEPILAALAAQNPRDASLVDDRARALIQLNRSAEAQQILARVVAQPALFPTPAALGNAAGDLAFAASRNNDPAAALQALEVRATVLPTSAAVLFLTAISHDKLHHVKLATEAYKQFLEASKGANPDEEFEARHRLIALEHMK